MVTFGPAVFGPDLFPNLSGAPGQITLIADDGRSASVVIAGDPDITLPGATYGVYDVEGAKPATQWRALTSATMTLTVAADARILEGSTEAQIEDVQALVLPPGRGDVPSVLMVLGVSSTVDNLRWLLQTVALTDRVVTYGVLARQTMSLEFIEAVDVAGLAVSPARRTRTKNNERRRRTVRSKRGDTLRVIAFRELGSASEWTSLRSWNKRLAKVDPDALLKPGTHIVLH